MKPARLGLLLLVAALTPGLGACGSDEVIAINARWTYQHEAGAMAAPGIGPDDRIVLASRAAPGSVFTRDALDGRAVEGPFETLPTAHAPVMIGAEIFLVGQVSGRVARLNLAGEALDFPAVSLGTTGPLVAAPDGSLRVVANRGELVALPGRNDQPVETPIGGVSDSPPAIDAQGVAFVATDVGRIVGVGPSGDIVFDEVVQAPASGPSVTADRVAVGGLAKVTVFDRSGAVIFEHPRGARVVGTRWLADGDLLAWGEDGRLDRYSPDGALQYSLPLGPPIYAEVHELPNQHLAAVDNDGTAYLISPDGAIIDRTEVAPDQSSPPLRQVAVGPTGYVYVTRGNTVAAFNFDFRP